jgi:DNA-binding NarL/FixJ family response regulator
MHKSSNCIKFNSEKDVIAIAILGMRLECKHSRRMIKPGSEGGVNLSGPENSSDCHQAIAKSQTGDRYCAVSITWILLPTREPSRLSLLTREQKTDADRPPCVANCGRKIAGSVTALPS